MAIDQLVLDSELLQALVLQYKNTNDQADFNAIYELTARRRKSAVSRAVVRYSRVDSAGLMAAADDGFMEALKRYDPEAGVPFSAFHGRILGRKIGRYVQSAYFTGRERDIERPIMADVALVPENVVAYTPEEPIREFMDLLESIDNALYEVTYLLVNGYNEETVGRVVGKRDTTDSAKSWTRRQKSKVASLLRNYRRDL